MDDSKTLSRGLYPPIEPALREHLAVGDGHRIYYEVCGNPQGRAVLFLHGGPGSCIGPAHRRFFDPDYWRVVLYDQRGCGLSTPLGSLVANDTAALIEDVERLRRHLSVERWVLFGGSWGSTLALAYAIAHPDRVSSLVLRGIFLGTRAETEWFALGLRAFLPELWLQFAPSPEITLEALLANYHAALTGADRVAAIAAARRWGAFENAIMAVGEAPSTSAASSDEVARARIAVQVHYLVHDCFLAPDALLDGVPRIAHLPAIVVQGRRDLPCPPQAAYSLVQHWPRAELRIVDTGGHSALHPDMAAALVRATDELRERGATGGA